MARPRNTRSPETIDTVIDEAALAAAGADATAYSQQIATIDQQYGIDIPYQLDIYVAAIRQRAAESAARLVEMGCLLIQVRERETRDVYLAALERAGITPRFAQRAMQAAIKLQDRKSVLQLGVSKALELLSEDDDTLDKLEAGGSIAGLTLDELDTMSVRELRATLRAERAERADEKAADEDVIRSKNERIDKLTREKRRVSRSSVRVQADDVLAEMDAAAIEAATAIKQLRDSISAVRALYDDAGEAVDEEVDGRIEQNIELARGWAEALANEALGG